MNFPMRGRSSSDVPHETLVGPAQLNTFINDLVRAWVKQQEGWWWYNFAQDRQEKGSFRRLEGKLYIYILENKMADKIQYK